MQSSKIASIILGAALLSIGCSAVPHEVGEQEEATDREEALEWVNGNGPDFFWQSSTQASLRALGAGALLSASGDLVSTPLAQSASGVSFLEYLVACALPDGVTAYSAEAGVTFEGRVGLASGWASSSLSDAASRRWVTACLLQSLNGLGANVAIHLSGSHPALADAPGVDVSAYTVEEATMFGDLFHPDGARAYACTDLGLVDACGAGASASTLQRLCGLSPTCGITVLGPCSLHCAAGLTGPTCTGQDGASYPEAISTKLEASLALDLHPLCSF